MKKIVALSRLSNYLKAREFIKDKGGLPPHKLLDEHITRVDGDEVESSFARKMLVYPESFGRFWKGIDIVDSFLDLCGRKQIFPACYIPYEAMDRPVIGLFIDPEHISRLHGRSIVHPRSIKILEGFLQVDRHFGLVDKKTGIPLTVNPDMHGLSFEQKRWLRRIQGIGVRNILREDVGEHNSSHTIYANCPHDYQTRVTYVE